jgi:predicted enzyme related to lactoylglutathione lyase
MDKVVHFEIPSDDMARAQKFYEQVFGWHIVSMPKMRYAILHTGPTDATNGMVQEKAFINGGMLKRQEPITSPVITINVDSIDEAAKKIEATGGKITRGKQQVGEAGFAAYFQR